VWTGARVLTIQEQLSAMAAARREQDLQQEEQHRAQETAHLIKNHSSTAAAGNLLSSIADPEMRDRLIKLKEKEDADMRKKEDHDKAVVASTLVAGDTCVNILRGGTMERISVISWGI